MDNNELLNMEYNFSYTFKRKNEAPGGTLPDGSLMVFTNHHANYLD